MTDKDPYESQKELDNRVCMFYVVDRIKDILKAKKDEQLKTELEEFFNEMIHNIGVNSIVNHFSKKN